MKFFVSGYKYNDLINFINFNEILKLFSPTNCYEGKINGSEHIFCLNLYQDIEKKQESSDIFYKEYNGRFKNFIDIDKHNVYTIYDYKFYDILNLFINCFNYMENFNITYDIISGYNSVTRERIDNKIILKDEKNRQNMIDLDNDCKKIFIEKKLHKKINFVYEVSINYITHLKKYEIPDEIIDIKPTEYKFPFSNIDVQDIKNIEEKKSINNIDLIDITIDKYFRNYEKYILTKLHLLYEHMDKNISKLIIEYCRFYIKNSP